MVENICHFIPTQKDYHALRIINFVLETKKQVYEKLRTEAVYKMYYVRSGQGTLHLEGRQYALKEDDIFFTFPGAPFCLESGEDFTYYYITFIGLRGNMLLDKCGISHLNAVFHDGCQLAEVWKTGMEAAPELSSLSSEAVLLYTFAFLGNRLYVPEETRKANDIAGRIKKYVEDHYFEVDFSLEKMSRELSYNAKYMSHVFKKRFGVGVVEYLNTVRIQNARAMMAQGFTGIGDIAAQCGYSDAQYFSKLFKKKTGNSPKNYIHTLSENQMN